MATAPVTSPVIALGAGEVENTLDFGFTTVTGSFLLGSALLDFVYAAVVGVGMGLLVGWVARLALARLEDSFVEIGVTLLAPYVAWVGAEEVHASGVLACVAGGIYLRQRYSTLATPVTVAASAASVAGTCTTTRAPCAASNGT